MLNKSSGAGTVVEMTGEEVIEATYSMAHQQEVYNAELIGIEKAALKCFKICQHNNLTKRHIWISTDNYTTIRCFNTFKLAPSQSTSLVLSNITKICYALKSTITVQ